MRVECRTPNAECRSYTSLFDILCSTFNSGHYILNLATDDHTVNNLSLEGTYITRVPGEDDGLGGFIFKVAYEDRGGSGLPSITGGEIRILRSSEVPASDIHIRQDADDN